MSKLDSEKQTLEEQLAIVRSMPAQDLLEAAYNYNWDYEPAAVLGAIADRPDCSLLTALQIFHHAEPGHYADPKNRYDGAIFNMLTRIHDRLNAGGYTHDPADHGGQWSFYKEWYLGQQDGDTSRKIGYWQLDPRIVLPACEPPPSEPPAISELDRRRAHDLVADMTGANEAKQRMAAMALVMANRDVQKCFGELLENLPASTQKEVAGLMRAFLKPKA